jgi:uncharacterized protein YkwD
MRPLTGAVIQLKTDVPPVLIPTSKKRHLMKVFPAAAMAVLFVIVILSPCASASTTRETTKAKPAVRLTEKEQRLVKAVNAYRAKHDLEPLEVDPILMCEARRAAPHFSHCIGGKWCWHRCHQRGFRGWATDDIANGYSTPEDAVQGWATSDGHARQMRGYFKMNGRWQNYEFNRIGVGISGRKYIAIFGNDSGPRRRG